MERITYKIIDIIAGQRLVKESLAMVGDDQTIELAIDFTGTDYEAWEKRCDLAMADGTTDILGVDPVVTDVIAVWTLTSAHTKKGALVINPYCQLDGARKGFPKKSVTIESQLTNDDVTASVRVIIEDYIDELLTTKVDKIAGKGLSTEDFTSDEKSKLSGIETGAEVNNISDVNATDLTDGGDTTLHKHDGMYYTESEVDTLLTGKSATTHHHDSDYADIDHNHDDDYAPITHTHDYSKINISATAPESPTTNMLWLDTSEEL
jgi:hypothetical protein